jgi:hypothetical protein
VQTLVARGYADALGTCLSLPTVIGMASASTIKVRVSVPHRPMAPACSGGLGHLDRDQVRL